MVAPFIYASLFWIGVAKAAENADKESDSLTFF